MWPFGVLGREGNTRAEDGAPTLAADPPVHGLVGAAPYANPQSFTFVVAIPRIAPFALVSPESRHGRVIGTLLASAVFPSMGIRTSRIPFSYVALTSCSFAPAGSVTVRSKCP